MKKSTLIIILVLSSTFMLSQTGNKTDYNFGFENISKKGQLPDKLINWSTPAYKLQVDSIVKHSGNNSMLIEFVGEKTEKSFGSCAFSIPGNYQGNQIELRAYMKLENVANGPIGLMLRIDGEGGLLKLDNMQQKNIQGTSDWALYSVKFPLPEEAKTIFVAALLSGTGKLWVDDFQLLIDGEDISIAKGRSFKADQDTEFDKGSKLNTINLTPSKINDLVILGKVWGFLKYYHPAIARGDYNWDYELFRIMAKIINSTTDDERDEILLNWVISLGSVENNLRGKIVDQTIRSTEDMSWIGDLSTTSEKLKKQILLIRDAKRSDNHYYIAFTPNGNPRFKNEKQYSRDLVNNDAGFRLLSLFRYWNMIQYFFPYKNLIGEDWNNVLTEFLPKFVNSSGENNYISTLLALIAQVHDTHATMWGNYSTFFTHKGINITPVEVKFIKNKEVVTSYTNKLFGEKSGLKIGDIIEKINSKSVNEIIKEKLAFTSASNYPTQLRELAKDMLWTNDSILNITYKRNNSISTLKLKCFTTKDIYQSGSIVKKDTCFKMLTQDIAYIYPGNIKNSYLQEIMEHVKGTRGLIIDLRCYPSEFIAFTLGSYLMPDSTSFVKFYLTSLADPGLFKYTKPLKVGRFNPDYYKGKVIVLVNEVTQSQAEYTAMAFRVAPKASVIGSTTAGADGDVSSIFLPGLINTMISGIGVCYPDGKETQRIGIIPDIELKPTIKGIMEGRDELLEKALEIISKK